MGVYIVYPTKEQQKALETFLKALVVPFEKSPDSDELPEHVIKGIAQGQADFEAGRFITFEEFKKKFPIR